jgi:peptidoglycan/LPS O-acetylase OafA/YrhL
MTRFENLLIGAFMAFIGVNYQKILVKSTFLVLPLFAVLVGIIILAVLNINFYVSESVGPILQSVVTPFLVSGLAGTLIAFLALVPSLARVMEHSVLNYLGKISFGLYVYHCLALTLLSALPLAYVPSSWLTTFGCTIFLTVLFAAISYKYFEKPFLAKSSNYRHI